MKIGIDGSRLTERATGVGRYTSGILAPLDKLMADSTFVVYARRGLSLSLPSDRWSIRYDCDRIWSRLPITYWIHYRLGSLARSDRLDTLWAPNTLLPREGTDIAPCVSTVLDFRYVFAPKELPPVTRRAYTKWANDDIRRATRVVAISEGTSARMLSLLNRHADAIAMPSVPLLPSLSTFEEAKQKLTMLGVRQPFLMTVGTSPCKNLPKVVDAVFALKVHGRLLDHQLVMVGARTPPKGGSMARAMAFNWIKPVGYVGNDALAAMYSLADALVFPSSYEGFGIPVAEAVALGCRVVTADSPELHEAGGPEATYVEPTVGGIVAGLDAALSQPAPAPREANHSWGDAARAMATVFRSV